MSDAPSTLVIGEARYFSTGQFRSVYAPHGNGSEGRAELIIERRVWTGRYWAEAGSREAMEAYRVFRNRLDCAADIEARRMQPQTAYTNREVPRDAT